MATFPSLVKKKPYVEAEETYVLSEGHTLPGHTVDALLAEGKLDDTRTEFQHLIQEGINSGPGEEMTPEYFAELRQRFRTRASAFRSRCRAHKGALVP